MFKYLEDIATADVAFMARGSTVEELFQECALATFEAMVNTKKVKAKIEKEMVLKAEGLEELLMEWLGRLIFLKDAETLAFSKFRVSIVKNEGYRLEGKAWGEEIDMSKHELRNDVKAVTYHRFELVEKKGAWEATVVLDI